jgi:hypothetical protein
MTKRDRCLPARVMCAAVAICVLGALVAGCGSRTFYRAGVVHTPYTQYRVGELSGKWEQVSDFGGDVAFLNGETSAVILANASCEEYEDASLKVLTKHLLIGFTDRETLSTEEFTLDGREALSSTVLAQLDGVQLQMTFVVIKKDYCIYDMSYTAPVSTYDAGIAEFMGLVQSFEVQK